MSIIIFKLYIGTFGIAPIVIIKFVDLGQMYSIQGDVGLSDFFFFFFFFYFLSTFAIECGTICRRVVAMT